MHYLPHLSKDKKLKKLLQQSEPFQLKKRNNICLYLCASIISQQLSTKVADVIYQRFLHLYGTKKPTASQIANTSVDKLRSIGLSNAKANYVKNVAQFEIEFGLNAKRLRKMTNEEVVDYLIVIKGVGKWTIEMLLMFALGREDIFAVDDLGIQNAMAELYKMEHLDKKELKLAMQNISDKWSPYRTYACLHLWHWKDNAPTPRKKSSKGKN